MLSQCQTRVNIIYFGENVAVIFSHKSKACHDGVTTTHPNFCGRESRRVKELYDYSQGTTSLYVCTKHKNSPRNHAWRFVVADWGY